MQIDVFTKSTVKIRLLKASSDELLALFVGKPEHGSLSPSHAGECLCIWHRAPVLGETEECVELR